jgi:asparagine synthase (glutamine-hydrolysing)
MSIQAGVWNLDGKPVERELLESFSNMLEEYGPDGEVIYIEGPLGMLYRAFYTTSESRQEHQPYRSDGGKIVTWDGRLDNRDELLSLLNDDIGSSHTDLAIVAAAFDRWGTDCFRLLLGDWATAIWDSRAKQLILARDYMGIRHLLYYPRHDRLVWCSHLAPLVLSGDRFTLSDEYVAGYLAFYPDPHLTPYREVHFVPPGTFVSFRNATHTIHTYWSFDRTMKTCYKTDAEYEEQYRYLFRGAVRRRLRTDSPILADLSGGFDSSSMVCMADDILTNEALEIPRLDTFSYYDSNEPGEDDLVHLQKVEEKRGRSGIQIDLRGSGGSLSFEPPEFDAIPGFGVRTEVKAGISDVVNKHQYRVILSGLGGDEMNGQPLDPRIQMADLLLQIRFVELSKQLMAWSLLIRKRPWIQLFFQTAVQLLPGPIRAPLTQMGKVEPWINRDFARRYHVSTRQLVDVPGSWFVRPTVRDSLQTISGIARQIAYIRPSFLEKRYPYLDRPLVEFLMTIPQDQLLRPGQRRSLMRRALSGILPPEILQRKTKSAAVRSYSVTLRKNWDKVESLFDSPLSFRLGYIDRDLLVEALARMKRGKVESTFIRLLRALCLEVWLRDAEARGIFSINYEVQRRGHGINL